MWPPSESTVRGGLPIRPLYAFLLRHSDNFPRKPTCVPELNRYIIEGYRLDKQLATLRSALLQVTGYLKLISRSKCPQQFFADHKHNAAVRETRRCDVSLVADHMRAVLTARCNTTVCAQLAESLASGGQIDFC